MSGVPRPDLTPPASIHRAVRLMWAGAVVSALAVLVGFATYGSYQTRVADQMRAADKTVSQTTIDMTIALGITFTVAVGLLGAVVWLWMAWKNGQGRAWARTIATMLGGLNVLFALLGIASGQSEPWVVILSVVNLALGSTILVLLWRRESTAFYDAVANSHTAQ